MPRRTYITSKKCTSVRAVKRQIQIEIYAAHKRFKTCLSKWCSFAGRLLHGLIILSQKKFLLRSVWQWLVESLYICLWCCDPCQQDWKSYLHRYLYKFVKFWYFWCVIIMVIMKRLIALLNCPQSQASHFSPLFYISTKQ